ncbi:MAG: Sua5/YciO/YrdC/YwlC family protein, partial [Myxococcota bacterium]|nr:Sua5/YciO/YrdC/YwlC family protein [Myxococcota bacterium]
ALLGEPVAAPSANRYQGLSPTTAAHVVKQLGDAVDLVLDAGDCETGIESTVVDVRGSFARVLRLGAIDLAALRARLPDLDARPERAAAEALRASPGMGARHYAPDVPLVLAASLEEAQSAARALAARGGRIGLVIHEAIGAFSTEALVRQLPRKPVEYARLLYRTLHDLEDEGVDGIVVQAVPTDDAWAAIADRLRRAASID